MTLLFFLSRQVKKLCGNVGSAPLQGIDKVFKGGGGVAKEDGNMGHGVERIFHAGVAGFCVQVADNYLLGLVHV